MSNKIYSQVLEYNIPNGKHVRGSLAVHGFKTFAKSEDLTPENIKLAIILGWCVEMVTFI